MVANYTKIIDFGKGMNDQVCSPLSPANPLSYCMFPTLNSQFIHGSSSSNLLYGTNNASCVSFMAERCANEWDGFCEAYQAINTDTYWPNDAMIDPTAYSVAQNFLRNKATIGENTIRNAGYLRFIRLPDYSPPAQPFDPTVANSPPVVIHNGPVCCSSVLIPADGASIEHDPLIQKMLDFPMVSFDVLARIYLGILRNEPESAGYRVAKLSRFFENNDKVFREFFPVALPRIPSFQYHRHEAICGGCSRSCGPLNP